MNVYDFDNTIYDGESVLDFYFYCVRRYPSLLKYLFIIFATWLRYKLLILSREKLTALAEKYAAEFFQKVRNVESMVGGFWDRKEKKIKKFYLEAHRNDDVVVSASVSFLLDEICARLGIKHCICSHVDTATGHVESLCFRQNKPGLFRAVFPEGQIANFYSDSMNDAPMMRIADRAYLVRGEKLMPVPKEKLKAIPHKDR